MKKTRIPKECLVCNNIFEAWLYSIKNGNGKFCSRSCAGAYHRGKESGRKGEKRPNVAGANNPMRRPEVKAKHRANIRRGESHPFWEGGVTPLYKIIRKSPEYIAWRKSVFARDSYTCQLCGLKPGNGKRVDLQADHIKPFAYFPALRFDINNGRTLCVTCHKGTETYGGKVLSLRRRLV